jgi:hypothetical protein
MAKYLIRGKNKVVDLNISDPLAVGGEGKIFLQGSTIYKIYLNPDDMIPDGKIRELKSLTRDNIIKPEDVILDSNRKPVGITMPYVDGHPLCKFFVDRFRKKNNVDKDFDSRMISISKDTITHIHNKNCLMVDGNEMGYIVSKDFKNVYFIDINAYQTPSYPADAINILVKDFHSDKFSEITDWFSWAVVICWLMTGIHPYKGGHPSYMDQSEADLIERMKKNVSIFNSNALLPSFVKNKISNLPQNYKSFFVDEFEHGKRLLPPDMVDSVILTPMCTRTIRGNNNFSITLLKAFNNDIVTYNYFCGKDVVTTRNSSKTTHYIYNDEYVHSSKDGNMILSPVNMTPVFIESCSNSEVEYSPRHCKLEYHMGMYYLKCGERTSRFILDNTLYLKDENNLYEIILKEVGSKIIITHKNCWKVLRNSGVMFDGFLYQRGLEKCFLYIPNPRYHTMSIKNIPELENYRIIDGRFRNGVCMIIGRKKSSYDKLIFRFGKDGSYDCRIIKDVDLNSINFAVLDNGICASIELNSIDIFRNIPNDSELNSIIDNSIDQSFLLWSTGSGLLFSNDNELYSIKSK